MSTRTVASPGDRHELEAGTELTPRFDARGLVTAVVTDEADGTLLMVAHMSAEALMKTVESGYAHFHSRSRERLWMKGESSGNVLAVKEIRVDCDQDTLWLKVAVGGDGVTCHTGSRSCFYRKVERRTDGSIKLSVDGQS